MYSITVEAGNDAGLGEATSCSCETEPDVPSEPTSLALVIGTLTESVSASLGMIRFSRMVLWRILGLIFRMEA
ncbi:hypothetical protein Avbf_13489 [Armadillidium vulgare]|nr:hypothetical protein Avbf_13489 [Armadillidium vulgare]